MPNTPITTAEWIAAFHQDWLDRGAGNPETWKHDYQAMFKFLPQDVPLTVEILHAGVTRTAANSRQRVRAVVSLSALARFAKIPYDGHRYRGKYSFWNSTKPRELPTDEQIALAYSGLADPHWRWVLAMMATYGLRNHEVFYVELDRLRDGQSTIRVTEGKTGPREVFPFPPEWFYEMELFKAIPPALNLTRSHESIGRSVTKYFRQPRAKDRDPLPFLPYDLRHRWAVRTLEFGLDPTLAAQQMGHSLAVHNSIYKKWIGGAVHARAYENILKNPKRPAAAKIPPRH